MLFQVTIPIASNIGANAPTNLGPYVASIVGALLTIAAVATLIYLIMGGINWITAGGDSKKIEAARDRITGALVGLAVVAVSWALFLIIDNFLGIGIAGGASTGNSSGSSSNTTFTPGQGTCIYPTRRCCDNVSDSTCFCQNPTYKAVSTGSCNAGGGTTGVTCLCSPR